MHMNRKSIRPYKKNLLEKNLIKINDIGNIISTQEDYRDSVFNSEVIALSFIDLLKRKPISYT